MIANYGLVKKKLYEYFSKKEDISVFNSVGMIYKKSPFTISFLIKDKILNCHRIIHVDNLIMAEDRKTGNLYFLPLFSLVQNYDGSLSFAYDIIGSRVYGKEKVKSIPNGLIVNKKQYIKDFKEVKSE